MVWTTGSIKLFDDDDDNLFDDYNGGFSLLVNKQPSLRPAFADASASWVLVRGEADRNACLGYG